MGAVVLLPCGPDEATEQAVASRQRKAPQLEQDVVHHPAPENCFHQGTSRGRKEGNTTTRAPTHQPPAMQSRQSMRQLPLAATAGQETPRATVERPTATPPRRHGRSGATEDVGTASRSASSSTSKSLNLCHEHTHSHSKEEQQSFAVAVFLGTHKGYIFFSLALTASLFSFIDVHIYIQVT
jgi:hypothetical protein